MIEILLDDEIKKIYASAKAVGDSGCVARAGEYGCRRNNRGEKR